MKVSMTKQSPLHFYVGTYTDAPSDSHGVVGISLDPQSGVLTLNNEIVPDTLQQQHNPSYLAATQNGLYTFNEVDRHSGAQLHFSDHQTRCSLAIAGDYPCHIDVKDKLLAVANYGSGNVTVYGLDEEGQPTECIADLFVDGCGPNVDRQEAPHAHQVTFLKHTNQLAVVDLGSDCVYFYDYDVNTLSFALNQTLNMPAGSGPRHLVFSHDESIGYVVCELSETLVVITKQNGCWEQVSQQALLANEENKQAASAIYLSPDERFLYVSCRAQNKISYFNVDGENVTQLAAVDCGGAFPRDFVISQNGEWLLVANQHSNDIVSYHRNVETGDITATGYRCNVGAPVCLVEMLSR